MSRECIRDTLRSPPSWIILQTCDEWPSWQSESHPTTQELRQNTRKGRGWLCELTGSQEQGPATETHTLPREKLSRQQQLAKTAWCTHGWDESRWGPQKGVWDWSGLLTVGLALAPPKDGEGMTCISPSAMLWFDFPERKHSLKTSVFI